MPKNKVSYKYEYIYIYIYKTTDSLCGESSNLVSVIYNMRMSMRIFTFQDDSYAYEYITPRAVRERYLPLASVALVTLGRANNSYLHNCRRQSE